MANPDNVGDKMFPEILELLEIDYEKGKIKAWQFNFALDNLLESFPNKKNRREKLIKRNEQKRAGSFGPTKSWKESFRELRNCPRSDNN